MRFCKHPHCGFSFALLALVWLAFTLPAKDKNTETDRPAAPTFSPPGGVFTRNVSLQITSTIAGGVVHYTLDGSEPLENSPVYSRPISIEDTKLVRARVFVPSGNSSPVAAEVFTMLDSDLASFSSNLPLVILNSFGTNIQHEHNVTGAIQLFDPGSAGRSRLTGKTDLASSCWVHIRGRASLRYPKHSYSVKLLNADGDSDSRQVLGLAADPDWVLYAPYPDKTLLRDVLAYELSRKFGYWSPGCRFVEVFVHASGAKVSRRDYVGVYVLEEKIKRGKSRI
ncbi:MAG TPA: CotH kinase family protein, partial [Candidatus Saccharimonadales bacterium]|nr:CotH kinase family protein [Candidatus Saccharimonadales bacterium]